MVIKDVDEENVVTKPKTVVQEEAREVVEELVTPMASVSDLHMILENSSF